MKAHHNSSSPTLKSKSRTPVQVTEVVSWFREHVKQGDIPTPEQCQGIVDAINVYAPYDLTAPTRDSHSEKIFEATSDAQKLDRSLAKMRALFPGPLSPPAIDELTEALASFLNFYPRRKQGSPRLWTVLIPILKPPIIAAFRAANHSVHPTQLPVAEESPRLLVLAEAIKRASGIAVDAATIADWVKKQKR